MPLLQAPRIAQYSSDRSSTSCGTVGFRFRGRSTQCEAVLFDDRSPAALAKVAAGHGGHTNASHKAGGSKRDQQLSESHDHLSDLAHQTYSARKSSVRGFTRRWLACVVMRCTVPAPRPRFEDMVMIFETFDGTKPAWHKLCRRSASLNQNCAP